MTYNEWSPQAENSKEIKYQLLGFKMAHTGLILAHVTSYTLLSEIWTLAISE